MIADELRRQADVFTDLIDLRSKFGRDPSERPAPCDSQRIGSQFPIAGDNDGGPKRTDLHG
jgi:hypothetical protein